MTNRTKLALFADDTAIISSSWDIDLAVTKANEHFQKIHEHLYRGKIKLNAGKTELIVFSRKMFDNKVISIEINDVKIIAKTSVKYLGVILDSKLDFKEHLKHARKKGYIAFHSLYNLLNRCSTLNISNKLLLYKMIIKPNMLYAAPVWINAWKTHIEPLEIVQNKVLRMISKESPRTSNLKIRKIFKLETFTRRKIYSKFSNILLENFQ